jgi:CubicO group peptidase (beta-lactamase class C family)
MKKSIKLIVLCLVLQFTAVSIFAQDKARQIDDLLSKYNEYGQFNGSALVAENGKIIFKKGFGQANMEWNIPNQPDTKFRLGSITKQFTAFLIVKLAEEGKIKLDVPITTYLPDYPKENGDKITIHHLITHTSGIPNYTSVPNFLKEKSRNPSSPEEFVKTFNKLSLDFKPGEKFSYSNSGYFLLGYIIEKITGKTYEQYRKLFLHL